VASSFYHSTGYNVSGYVDLEVEFYFYAYSMDNSNEDFWVQYYDGSSWSTVAALAQGIDFNNNTFYNVIVTIPAASYNYPTNARLRFMCDASGNADDVYIDAIEFRGQTAGGAAVRPTVTLRKDREGPVEVARIEDTALLQNTPNPFNPQTMIAFNLAEEQHVTITVFDVSGRRVATLIDEVKGAGLHEVQFNASGLSSGIYFYRLQAGEVVEQRKMVLLK